MIVPRLYPIVDLETLTARGVEVARFTSELINGGAEILQLRDKKGSPAQILRHAAAISDVIASSPCVAVMNDRVDLALLAGWRAVHVGDRDMPPDAVREAFGRGAPEALIVGVSTHNDQQVSAAEAGTADYVAIGPVFATGTKADAEPVVGLEGVRRARAITRKPLVAIGGITRANARAVVEAGADSVAVIGGLFAEGESTESIVRDFLLLLR